MKEKLNQAAEVKITYKPKVKSSDRPKISKSSDAAKFFKMTYAEGLIEYREEFKVMLLNRANCILGIRQISAGGVSGTFVCIKQVMQAAILSNASAIILCHNHPSGSLQPSEADCKLTEKIKLACGYHDIELLDRVIIRAEDDHFSFADEHIL